VEVLSGHAGLLDLDRAVEQHGRRERRLKPAAIVAGHRRRADFALDSGIEAVGGVPARPSGRTCASCDELPARDPSVLGGGHAAVNWPGPWPARRPRHPACTVAIACFRTRGREVSALVACCPEAMGGAGVLKQPTSRRRLNGEALVKSVGCDRADRVEPACFAYIGRQARWMLRARGELASTGATRSNLTPTCRRLPNILCAAMWRAPTSSTTAAHGLVMRRQRPVRRPARFQVDTRDIRTRIWRIRGGQRGVTDRSGAAASGGGVTAFRSPTSIGASLQGGHWGEAPAPLSLEGCLTPPGSGQDPGGSRSWVSGNAWLNVVWR